MHSPSTDITLGETRQGPTIIWQAYPQYPASAHGKDVWLRLVHRSSDGSQKDAIVQKQIHDTITGMQVAMPKLIAATSTGGLTPVQDAALMSTNAAVQLDLGSGFFQPISALLGNMPPSLLQRELITPDRTGEGDLTRPGGALTVAAQGLMWQVVSAPVGIGIDEGAPDTYEIDVLQLGFVRSLNDGSTYFGDTSVIRQPVGVWAWGSVTPTRIHYWVTPGVTIRFWWLNPWWGVLAPPSWLPSPPL